MNQEETNAPQQWEGRKTASEQSPEDMEITGNNESSSDDEYLSSDQDNSSTHISKNNHLDAQFHNPSSLSNHAKYFTNSIVSSLDSSDVDKSLVLEAQISGNLNNENQKLVEKTNLLRAKVSTVQALCDSYFGTKDGSKVSRAEKLRSEISIIEKRLSKLKYGGRSSFPTSLIKTQKSGVIEEYPVEYFQARDKVLERVQE
ncbi:KXD1 [Candida margitis]|uniref:KXD1 n=1 Tax=Candida margitis TaxID=1775924 RepID=UPI00222692C4|nr:KXD1 [Candida margitis]KAI5970388.1 KXD1 [Candida margitis]